ncbi:hypothetical protein CEUSTIGMA_g8852.t1 [Chlamydomonas eustigma]|uniref:Uncharacterized protein n=1 Tax=Chlamydomonas eustigma TaxID=1157962 RepID=A0A250XES6_9CHLO|nr:hypothetical protein CEUSTIGMA_g8852.t1 [Chlamydomonas eustigma]|eukprot:GAX81422.1 hypothetical protein CEUSTIGMA_g8852.t1 [Chlamydomonas eustigma]
MGDESLDSHPLLEGEEFPEDEEFLDCIDSDLIDDLMISDSSNPPSGLLGTPGADPLDIVDREGLALAAPTLTPNIVNMIPATLPEILPEITLVVSILSFVLHCQYQVGGLLGLPAHELINHLQRVDSKSSPTLLAYRQNQLEEAAAGTLVVMSPAPSTHALSVAAAIQQVPHYDQTSFLMSAVAAQHHYTSAVTAPHLPATTKQQLNNSVNHLDVSSSTSTRKRNIQAGVKIAVLDRYCDSVKSAVSVAQQSVSSILDRLKAAATSVTTSRRLAKQAKKKDQT